jgi:phosphoserine phosphatase RsbU/P
LSGLSGLAKLQRHQLDGKATLGELWSIQKAVSCLPAPGHRVVVSQAVEGSAAGRVHPQETTRGMKDLSESRVLIVDDDRSNVDVLVEALRRDYKLSVALDGQSALWNIQMSPPDLVLLDIVMPGMDGYEVCRRLRSAPATREIPILFLSGLEQVEAKAKGFEMGGNDYVTKPFETLEVQARVRSLLKAKAYADAVKERWASELRIAREIQLKLLPSNLTLIGQGSGLDIDGLLQPAEGVGGDFYEVLRTTGGQLLFVMGDVSGKGIPAALLMAVTLTVVRTMACQFQEPEVILRWVRDALAAHGTEGLAVTLFCGIYDQSSGRLAYSSAGHPPPALRRDGHSIIWPQEPGQGVGSPRGFALSNSSITLRPGDALLLYTNGLVDGAAPSGDTFGEVRLIERLNRTRAQTSRELVADILKSLQNHMKDVPQPDDIALLAVRRLE